MNQPYLAGVFAGSLFWVGVCYAFQVLPGRGCKPLKFSGHC